MTCPKSFCKILAVLLFLIPAVSQAGNISTSQNMAWGDKLGWINFAPDNGNVTVTDTALTGYVWSANYGWINLDPDNGGVVNDGNGNLSGYAWGSNVGWINFAGVTINSGSGIFSGRTTDSSLAGTITFSCDNCAVVTSWRKTEPTSHSSTGSTGYVSVATSTQLASAIEAVTSVPTYLYDHLVPNFLKLAPEKEKLPSIEEVVTRTPPLVLSGIWNVFPHTYTDAFVLAPLPKEIRNLAQKFPDLKKILTDVGVTKITDLDKLRLAKISLPNMSAVEKVPSEIVFAGHGLLNLASAILISDQGLVEQRIETIVNKSIKLSVKPEGAAESVTGYVAFRSRPQNMSARITTDSILASAIMALLPSATREISVDTIEKKMIVSSFAYSDEDKDGIYTAEILAPQTEGEYEVITLIKYSNPELGTKEMRLITVVDPEGYVYERLGPLEARVPGARISIFKDGALWNAKEYNQDNPQVTDKTGKYSFLVPEGEYYVTAEASGYKTYKGEVFNVREGKGVHFNIEMVRSGSWLRNFLDWKVIIILILAVALALNFWNEKRLFKKLASKDNNLQDLT